ncbi:protein required for attachment to host cells [Yoonia maricola]|uniref:Protein required for attachment to host cells n=1 Tax=Yoonia maricola TaxID=420999 RepID=A0A2M8WMC4_9RHOB|nr:host attachment protein [Yoonia maricola]PJI92082.1 protein required for attachment to host cells [Yoonia maricola]
MKPIKTWIVLADAQTVRVAVNDGPGKGVYGHHVEGLVPPEVTELSDAPGMTNAPNGPNRGGISNPDLKGQAVAGFATDIVAYLDRFFQDSAFQRLVLIAPPAMLGVLRQTLSAPLRDALLGDMPKDLTHLPLDDLPAHLEDMMVV